MAADSDAVRINLSGKAGDALIERGQRIENVRDVPRAAFPERGFLSASRTACIKRIFSSPALRRCTAESSWVGWMVMYP